MTTTVLTTNRKAQEINQGGEHYGTFAEIGAGQEVARHFFQAGHASATIAKTMSAYDKTFSDEIYGRGSRFVSQERLIKMLDHEYVLVEERLSERREDNAFFVFANTVATSSHDDQASCHGWLGMRFQTRPGGPINDIIVHARMLDRLRLGQQEALGILGVNLIHAAFFRRDNPKDFVASLIENLGVDRMEVDHVVLRGEEICALDERLISLELVQQGLTQAVLFGPDGMALNAADGLYKKPLLIQRGTFRPITNTNMDILEKGLSQMRKDCDLDGKEPVVLFEVTMKSFSGDGEIDHQDFLDRVDTLSCLGHHVLVSNYPLFSQLSQYLRTVTEAPICLVVGASVLEQLFQAEFYAEVEGGLLGALSRLFSDQVRMLVFPFKSELTCQTAVSFKPDEEFSHLYKHFIQSQKIKDIGDCDNVDTSIHSGTVRKMLSSGDKTWEELVPNQARALIKRKCLFGYKE